MHRGRPRPVRRQRIFVRSALESPCRRVVHSSLLSSCAFCRLAHVDARATAALARAFACSLLRLSCVRCLPDPSSRLAGATAHSCPFARAARRLDGPTMTDRTPSQSIAATGYAMLLERADVSSARGWTSQTGHCCVALGAAKCGSVTPSISVRRGRSTATIADNSDRLERHPWPPHRHRAPGLPTSSSAGMPPVRSA